MARIKHWVAELLTWTDMGRVLYIGAHKSHGRKPALLGCIRPHSTAVDCLEIFKANIEYLKDTTFFDTVTQGDVREAVEESGFAEYDTVVWWHGPEHVAFEDGVRILQGIRSRRIWIGCPHGPHPHGIAFGNPNEQHISEWHFEDFENLGFRYQRYRVRRQEKISAWKIS